MEALVATYLQPQFRGAVIKEYLLVVKPEMGVRQRVMDDTIHSLQIHSEGPGPANEPQITIAKFFAKEEMEETIIRWTHRVISSKKIFRVALNNYGGLPHTKTIYLRVQDAWPFRQLAKELKVISDLVRDNGMPGAQLFSNPHLAVANNIAPGIYDQVMLEYSKKDFHAEFDVQELVLLKRTQPTDQCRLVNVFRLQP